MTTTTESKAKFIYKIESKKVTGTIEVQLHDGSVSFNAHSKDATGLTVAGIVYDYYGTFDYHDYAPWPGSDIKEANIKLRRTDSHLKRRDDWNGKKFVEPTDTARRAINDIIEEVAIKMLKSDADMTIGRIHDLKVKIANLGCSAQQLELKAKAERQELEEARAELEALEND